MAPDFIKVDFLVERIENMSVNPQPAAGEMALVFKAVSNFGIAATIGLMPGAFEKLVQALILNSPGVPGTPGRN